MASWIERIDRALGIKRPHPRDMFCDATLDRFRRGDRRPNAAKWKAITGRDHSYELLRDTVIWEDEDCGIDCAACMNTLAMLFIWRRRLWGEPATPLDRQDVWENVQRRFPDWPGFRRVAKPDGVDNLLAEGREEWKAAAKNIDQGTAPTKQQERNPMRVLYAGAALSGRCTSLAHVLDSASPAIERGSLRRPTSPLSVTWSFDGDEHPLLLSPTYVGALYLPRFSQPPTAGLSESVVAQVAHLREYLRTVEGVVFVVDSQRERADANVEALAQLRTNLADADREPDAIPLVFQLNKRDLPSASSGQELRELLPWADPVFVDSVASTGVGVDAALRALLARIERSRGSR